ncbi:MAG: hypothetical protein HZA54_17695 [Planctomycetes bacterium]|nr:hypothetical protein [Planctomycetota bacterium]
MRFVRGSVCSVAIREGVLKNLEFTTEHRRAIGVQLLDHLVISRAGGYYSFSEAGLL